MSMCADMMQTEVDWAERSASELETLAKQTADALRAYAAEKRQTPWSDDRQRLATVTTYVRKATVALVLALGVVTKDDRKLPRLVAERLERLRKL